MTTPPSPAAPGFPADPGTAELIGYGRITWDQLTSMLTGAHAAWADYAGFHIGEAPAEPPPYTHLWAWSSRWILRARIDGDTAITGVLALDGEPHPAPPALSRQTVHYQHAKSNTWPQTEKRVGQLTVGIADRTVDIYLIAGEHPITFAAASNPAGATAGNGAAQTPQP